jgi:hypothetical protein
MNEHERRGIFHEHFRQNIKIFRLFLSVAKTNVKSTISRSDCTLLAIETEMETKRDESEDVEPFGSETR